MRYILALLLTISLSAPLRVVSDLAYSKIVNGDAGLEVLLKTTIPMQGFDIKLGASETFTAHRSSPYSMNHGGTRIDIGALWMIGDVDIGYTHSHRGWFDGANPKSVYINDSVDTVYLRKEFEL